MITNILWIQGTSPSAPSLIYNGDELIAPTDHRYYQLYNQINKDGMNDVSNTPCSKFESFVITGHFVEVDELGRDIPFMSLIGNDTKENVLEFLETKCYSLGYHIKDKKVWAKQNSSNFVKVKIGIGLIVAACISFLSWFFLNQ